MRPQALSEHGRALTIWGRDKVTNMVVGRGSEAGTSGLVRSRVALVCASAAFRLSPACGPPTRPGLVCVEARAVTCKAGVPCALCGFEDPDD